MIKGISIENFRCFHKTEINKFGMINLLGGKNNAGKTTLLEAIYIALKGSIDDVVSMRQYGYQNDQDSNEAIFFNQNTDQLCKIRLNVKDIYYDTLIEMPEKKINVFTQMNSINFDPFENDKTINSSEFWLSNKQSIISAKDTQYPELNLNEEFDKIDIRGESNIILKGIQLIDSSISEIKTYSSKPNIIYLRRKNERALPLPYFGDALQKIMKYFITMVHFDSKSNLKCLLIDEIENGLHYTVHKKFWEMLFKLANEYNIQVFATTHSREMIEAFAEIAEKPEFIGKGLFFEMFRHIKTNEIVANKFNVNTLEYNLQNNLSLRGE